MCDTDVTDLIAPKLMLAFDGLTPPAALLTALRARPYAGLTLFRARNVRDPAQTRALTAALQTAVAPHRPLLIATDQEGGQLVALGDGVTQFPGNMALGAARDADLAFRVGQALGAEMAALGVNVNYGPVCDVNTNPRNPNVGVRAFSDDPALAAELSAALIGGLQAAGVAATAKHFPGNGESDVDPHFGLPALPFARARLDAVELRPFRAAIAAGARLLMTAHVAAPALTGQPDLPATLSRAVMHNLLRKELGYTGLLISDALDMQAITQGSGQIVDVLAAVRAGVDVLLLTADAAVAGSIEAGLRLAQARGLLANRHLRPAAARVRALKQWLGRQPQPDLSVVGCAAHRALEAEAARRALTLVRDDAGLLPLRPASGARLAAIMPRPANLTPADTSAFVAPALAEALRAFHPAVDEYVVSQAPTAQEIAALREQTAAHDLLVVGTISASMQPAQVDLVAALLATGKPVVTAALRTPYDLAAYPAAATHVCAYSVQPAALRALAAALFGRAPFTGRLPVSIPDLYLFGHGMVTNAAD